MSELPALGRGFRFLRKLGEGWSAEVFEAELMEPRYGLEPGTRVALKAYRPEIYDQDANIRQRIERESHLMMQIDHPNVLSAFDLLNLEFQGESRLTLVLEFCGGGDLESLVSTKFPLGPEEILAVVTGLVAGLSEIRRAGILHRDLKPQNILVAENDICKVGDFGVARHILESTVTGTEQFLGTLRYAPPEVLDGARETEKSDIYSLGTVFYQILYGRPPIDDVRKFTAIITAISRGGLDWPEGEERFAQVPTLAHLLVELMSQRMCLRRPEERPTIQEVCQWLAARRRAAPLQAALIELVLAVLTEKVEEWKRERSSTAFVFVGYNARRIAEALTDEEAVRVIIGYGASVIEAREELLDCAVAFLPFNEYAQLSKEKRHEFVDAFRSGYRPFVEWGPWDEHLERKRREGIYRRSKRELIDLESDPEILKKLGVSES
ncbi:MAG: serine/threonine protein kinase [Deltaproteobacteria bacterium]|nr:serine/threonine protein kinase [Deltaproteobacteria bacterium]